MTIYNYNLLSLIALAVTSIKIHIILSGLATKLYDKLLFIVTI
jgi:hypothetical protein